MLLNPYPDRRPAKPAGRINWPCAAILLFCILFAAWLCFEIGRAIGGLFR
jgi:hypothetical protein